MNKVCKRCGIEKTTSDFRKRKQAKDGLQSYCRECANRRNYEYREASGKEKNRLNQRKWRLKTEYWLERRKQYVVRSPDKAKAHNAINNAVRSGRMRHISTQVCARCGAPAEEYHHYRGYAPEQRLKVVPLCRGCHKQVN